MITIIFIIAIIKTTYFINTIIRKYGHVILNWKVSTLNGCCVVLDLNNWVFQDSGKMDDGSLFHPSDVMSHQRSSFVNSDVPDVWIFTVQR